MKKIFCLLLCTLILIVAASSVRGDELLTVGLRSSTEAIHRGDIISFTISLDSPCSIRQLSLLVLYDPEVFVLESGGWLITDAQSADFSDGTATLSYTADHPVSGDILTFRLRVLETAPLNQTQVSCQTNAENSAGALACTVTPFEASVVCLHSYHPWAVSDETQHSRACTACGFRESSPHDYTNPCDTSCNTCGYTRQISHSFSEEWFSDGDAHYHACTSCGIRQDEEPHLPGEPPTEATPQYCTVCNFELSPALGHSHQLAEGWVYDTAGHWYACIGCELRLEEAVHNYDNRCDTDCNICGAVREISHRYSDDWQQDPGSHWHICTVCGETDSPLEHTPGAEPTEETPQVCTACGRELTPALVHQHTAQETYHWDQLNHWTLCECGECTEFASHTWDEGIVIQEPTAVVNGERLCTCTVCGATKTIELWMEPEPAIQIPEVTEDSGEEASMPMLVIGILIGAAGCITVRKALKKPASDNNA